MIKQLCDSNDGAAPEDGLGWAGIDGAGRVSFLMRHSRFAGCGFDTSSLPPGERGGERDVREDAALLASSIFVKAS